jgi:hypothetical protein
MATTFMPAAKGSARTPLRPIIKDNNESETYITYMWTPYLNKDKKNLTLTIIYNLFY